MRLSKRLGENCISIYISRYTKTKYSNIHEKFLKIKNKNSEIPRIESIIKLHFKLLACNFMKKVNSFAWIFQGFCINFQTSYKWLPTIRKKQKDSSYSTYYIFSIFRIFKFSSLFEESSNNWIIRSVCFLQM